MSHVALKNLVRTMDEVAKLDLAPWGYAPGDNHFYCDQCQRSPYPTGNWPHRGHKHSTRCIEHALEARLREIRCCEDAPAIHLELEIDSRDPDATRSARFALVSLFALLGMVAIALFASL